MELSKIISITGKPGLFELISQTKGGFIVKDIDSKKKFSISSKSQVSLIENVSIYTLEDDINLVDVFVAISNNNELKEFSFEKNEIDKLRDQLLKAVPNYDKDRVYDSDVRKIFYWYNILIKNDYLNKDFLSKHIEEKSITSQDEIKNIN